MSVWFVKLHRKLLDNPIASNPLLIWLFCYLLLLVSHKDHIFFLWKIKIEQKKWQAIISKKQIAKDFKISRWTLDSYLSILESEHIISIKSTSKYTVLTIINWCKYQELDTTIASTWTSTWHQLEHQPDTINNDNNDKEWKEKIISKDTTIVEWYTPDPITISINNVISEIKNKMDDYWIVYSWEDERMFGKHILSKKRNKIASQYKFNDWIEFAKFIIDCSMQDWNWRKYKVCSIKLLYQKYAQIINSYQESKDKKSSNVSTF